MANVNPETAVDVGWLVKAAHQMLRPVARLLVGKLSCQVAIGLLKESYVLEARRQLRANDPNKRVTKSALALLTGLDTRAIASVEDDVDREISSSELCPEAAVLEAWFSQATFNDPETGKPLVLPIYGKGVCFQTLVSRNAGRNVTCPTVLDRLYESGNIELVDRNHVRLVSPHYVPVNASEQTVIEVGSASLNRLGRTLAHNHDATSPEERWLHQDRWSQSIPLDRVDEIRGRIREMLNEQIGQVESELEKVGAPVQKSNHGSVGVGWFYWEDTDKKS